MTLDEAIAILKSPEGKDETKRVFRLNRAVDVAEKVIASERTMTREEAEDLVDHVASIAETLFPGSRDTFDIVYARRMRRVIAERFGAGD
jgi:hypothetical protein